MVRGVRFTYTFIIHVFWRRGIGLHFGLVLGEVLKKPVFGTLRREKALDFWSNIAFLAQSVIFLVLGAGFSISVMASVWLQATMIILLLFFVIRPISVLAATHFEKKLTRNEKLFLSWMGARVSTVRLYCSGSTLYAIAWMCN